MVLLEGLACSAAFVMCIVKIPPAVDSLSELSQTEFFATLKQLIHYAGEGGRDLIFGLVSEGGFEKFKVLFILNSATIVRLFIRTQPQLESFFKHFCSCLAKSTPLGSVNCPSFEKWEPPEGHR